MNSTGYEMIIKTKLLHGILTVALVIRKRDSWVTVSTSGELFMMVLTLAKGRFAPPRFDIFEIFDKISLDNLF